MAKKGWVYDFSHNSQDFFSLFKLEGIFVKSFTYSSGKAFSASHNPLAELI